MRSLNTPGAAETAEELHEKQGQEMACFGTPEINSAVAAVAKQTHQVRACSGEPCSPPSLRSACCIAGAGARRRMGAPSDYRRHKHELGGLYARISTGMDQLEVLAGP